MLLPAIDSLKRFCAFGRAPSLNMYKCGQARDSFLGERATLLSYLLRVTGNQFGKKMVKACLSGSRRDQGEAFMCRHPVPPEEWRVICVVEALAIFSSLASVLAGCIRVALSPREQL